MLSGFNSLPGDLPGAYTDVVERGSISCLAKTFVIAKFPVAVIEKTNKEFAAMTDANFELDNVRCRRVLQTTGPGSPDPVKNNPDISMEIAAHTDNMGAFR